MIKTKKELFELLDKRRKSPLDKFMEISVSEKVLRELIEDREEDNKYFFEKLDEINKRLEIIERDIKKKNLEISRLYKQKEEWKRIAQNKEGSSKPSSGNVEEIK